MKRATTKFTYKGHQFSQLAKGASIRSVRTDEMTTTEFEAEMIARVCHGLFDWQGVKSVKSNIGLKRLADKWLRDNNVSCGSAMVIEEQYCYQHKNGEYELYSVYTPAWNEIKPENIK